MEDTVKKYRIQSKQISSTAKIWNFLDSPTKTMRRKHDSSPMGKVRFKRGQEEQTYLSVLNNLLQNS